jgi:hypothetical protein
MRLYRISPIGIDVDAMRCRTRRGYEPIILGYP